MEQGKPPFLYHGRQTLVDIIEPEQPRGQAKKVDQLLAVYASHERYFAIPSAFPILPDREKGLTWGFNVEGEQPRIKIKYGWLHPTRVGYLYRVPLDTFTKIDEHRWVSNDPVTPFDYEIIHPWDYLHWFETSKVVLKPGSFEKRRMDRQFALAVTLCRIMNSLTSTWRLSLSFGNPDSVVAQRERMQSFLNNIAVLYEGIKTFYNNQVYLRDLNWFKSHIEDIKVINKERADAKSFYNTVLKEIRHKLTFHFDPEFDRKLLMNPELKIDHPVVIYEGITSGVGEAIHPLSDRLMEAFLINIYVHTYQDTISLEGFLTRFYELQNKFIDIIGNLIPELIKDDIEMEGGE
jgi:hypothetical protein